MDAHLPLSGKTALVTGVSRRRGIGFSIAQRLALDGANVVISHYAPHDEEQPWGADDLTAVCAELRTALRPGAKMSELGLDLAEADAPAQLIDHAMALTGTLDILVCNQARSGSDGSILDTTASMLDGHYQVNARATVLLTSLFARAFAHVNELPAATPGQRIQNVSRPDEHRTGRVIWLTSGQSRPMPGEVCYAMSKAALAGLTPTVASELIPLGILLNTINPGPVDTGYLDPAHTDRSPELIAQAEAMMPLGRFGLPDDVARLVAWLVSDEGRWVAGQVITSDSGFSL